MEEMTHKIYDAYCDGCGKGLNHYGSAPTATRLRKDGVKVKYQNGKMLTFCVECFNQLKKK
mgnify:CR=1 FL=1